MMDDERATGSWNDGAANRTCEFGLAEGPADIKGGGRHAGRVKRVVGQAGAFADAAHSRKQAGDGNRESTVGRAVGKGSNDPADMSDDLRPGMLRQSLPQPTQWMAARRRTPALLLHRRCSDAGRGPGKRLQRRVHCSIPMADKEK
jgi:hypothetical protein